ncbi:unnamed protein product [Mycena citricolor]|uniref:Uncharacterized protein n=1 Tax=Mycena citricolor TaxID=2018698 RepID=A0AAD2Q5V6_9AGAR|nr:unnamed protein product [Mycena citricolor]
MMADLVSAILSLDHHDRFDQQDHISLGAAHLEATTDQAPALTQILMAPRRLPFKRKLFQIISRIFGPVLTVTLFATGIAYASHHGYVLFATNSIVPLLSVVVGLILVFRNGTSYDRWWEGRKCFASITSNVRSLTRLVWINVALPPTDDQPGSAKGKTPTTEVTSHQLHRRKTEVLQLCAAFAFATKHYLRGEDGLHWNDYHGVLPAAFIRADEVGFNTQHTTASSSYAATLNHSAPSSNGGSTDHIATRPDATKRVRPKRSKQQVGPRTPLLSGTQRTVEFHPYADEASMPLPLVIAHEITRKLFQFRREGFLETVGPAGMWFISPGTTQNADINSRYKCYDCYVCFRRVLLVAVLIRLKCAEYGRATDLHGASGQYAYSRVLVDGIHLKQCVTLYLFALPLTLVKELGWAMVPLVTVVAFTFMVCPGFVRALQVFSRVQGIEGIADELEQPYGDDTGDLPLDRYCKDLKEEVDYMIERLPEGGEGIHGWDDGEGDD